MFKYCCSVCGYVISETKKIFARYDCKCPKCHRSKISQFKIDTRKRREGPFKRK